jgi:ATP-binding cassette subfamily F protein 3
VAELRFCRLHHFQGNYDAFLVERERRLQEHAKRYELQQAEIARQEDFVRRNIAGQKTKQAQARRRMLEKLDRVPPPEWPASSIHMSLPEASRTGRMVVEAKGLAKRYGDRPVFKNVTFQIQRGQKVGLIGPNGVGKTTLIRLLVGEESQDEGTLRVGTGVQIGYQEQEQKRLTGTRSVQDEIWQLTPQANETEIRSFLGGFLFRGDDVFKPLNALSGGEKSRVALARLVRQGANFLILDEPTNHLDIESREVMEAALQAFQGTVLAVSHDRYFLDQVADHILVLDAQGCRLWEGGYSRYAAASGGGEETAGQPRPEGASRRKEKVGRESTKPESSYEEQKRRKREEERLRRRLADAEELVGKLDVEKEDLLLHMADPTLATNAEELGALNARLQELEDQVAAAISEWEAADRRLHAFLDGDNS